MLPTVVFGLFGLVVGSFLNVLILRRGERPLTGRSVCETCKEQIAWYDLIPVLSWVALRGRCRACGESISIQYPIVELLTAAAFALVGAAPMEPLPQLLALLVISLLIAIAVYDLHHTIIPDEWVYLCAALALLYSLPQQQTIESSFLFLLAGPLVSAPLFGFWFFSRGTWMGFGDVKLALVMGWLLGFAGGLQALMLGFILGAAVSTPLLILSSEWWIRFRQRFTPTNASPRLLSGFTMKSEVPFGPFLIVATFIVWFLKIHGVLIDPILWGAFL